MEAINEPAAKTRILIAEDSRTQALVLKNFLENHGFNVNIALNGIEALKLIKADKPDIVISDILMPQMDGYELCRQIKTDSELESIPVILLTTLSHPDDVLKALEARADNFITKQDAEEILLSRIHLLMGSINKQNYSVHQSENELLFSGKKYIIDMSRQQIFEFLLSTYETAILRNHELQVAREELKKLNEHLEEKVVERTIALKAEIQERIRAEEKLQENNRLLNAVGRAQNFFIARFDIKTVFNGLLSDLLHLTKSEFGFIGKIRHSGDNRPFLKTLALTGIGEKESRFSSPELMKGPDLEYIGNRALFDPQINICKPIICNDRSLHRECFGDIEERFLPESLLVLPFYSEKRLVGLLCIANRPGGYDEKLAESLNYFSSTCVHLIEAYKNEQKRKEAEDAVQKSEVKFKSLFNSASDAIFIIDLEGKIKEVNQAACERLGYKRIELLELKPKDIDSPDFAPVIPHRLEELLERGQLTYEAGQVTREGKTIPVEINCRIIDYEEKIAILSIARDITERKQAQEKLHELEVAQMKQEFVATITHDLKSPLSAMMGFAELLSDPRFGEISPKKLDYVRMIKQSGNMLLSLILNIVNVYKIEAKQMNYTFENVNLNEYLNELNESFHPLALSNNISLDFSCPENSIAVMDKDKMQQVFHNLLSNAFRYTPPEGKITIRAENEDEHLRFTISDTGKGIPQPEQVKLFQKFAQVKGERRGTGLGLYIVKNILEGHGFSITLESEVGKGTSFFFRLKKGKPDKEILSFRGRLVLAGEDSHNTRLLKVMLMEIGHKLEYAPNGKEAIKLAQLIKPNVIIVHDPLPDLTINDFKTAISEINTIKTIPLIVMTPLRTPDWEDGSMHVVHMPTSNEDLKAEIEKAVRFNQ